MSRKTHTDKVETSLSLASDAEALLGLIAAGSGRSVTEVIDAAIEHLVGDLFATRRDTLPPRGPGRRHTKSTVVNYAIRSYYRHWLALRQKVGDVRSRLGLDPPAGPPVRTARAGPRGRRPIPAA
jgi:hypothetical protein